jgi:hypothetical protein
VIVKKVKNPQKSASKAARIQGLARYIVAPEREGSDEKCLYAGARGFLTDAPQPDGGDGGLVWDAVRSRDPVNHYVWLARGGSSPAQGGMACSWMSSA